MSGRHPWNKLFEETFSPEQRARIIRDAEKLVDDNRIEPRQRREPRPARQPRTSATASTSTAAGSRLDA